MQVVIGSLMIAALLGNAFIGGVIAVVCAYLYHVRVPPWDSRTYLGASTFWGCFALFTMFTATLFAVGSSWMHMPGGSVILLLLFVGTLTGSTIMALGMRATHASFQSRNEADLSRARAVHLAVERIAKRAS